MIDAEGSVVGQVNGLSVYSLGNIMFGRPSRITARTYMGRSGVINIERESHLSGSIHDKGVLILNGYLGWKYAQQRPLSLSASLCFEQSLIMNTATEMGFPLDIYNAAAPHIGSGRYQ